MKKLHFAIFVGFVVAVILGFYMVCIGGVKGRCLYDVAICVGCPADSIPVNVQGITINISDNVSAHVTTVSELPEREESVIHATLRAPTIQKWSLQDRVTSHSILVSRTTVMAAVRNAAMIPTDVAMTMKPENALLP